MKSISDVLEHLVAHSPLLEEGLSSGIINLSALARQLRPQVEEELVKEVSEAALVMALRRLAPSLSERVGANVRAADFVSDLNVRSGLCELTFLRSESLIACQGRLLSQVAAHPGRFITFSQGASEMTTILDARLVRLAEKIFADERLVTRLDDLAALTVRLSPETVQTPGVYYLLLKQLALNALNVVEVVSTSTELTIMVEQAHVDRAFTVLLRAATR